jgi:predicted nucleic acid-binding protein
MAGPTPAYVLDTNVLLGLYKPDSPEFSLIRQAISSLHRANAALYYFSQNLVEFWNVSTRPAAQNGYGLSAEETEKVATEIENTFTLLPEVNRIHQEWRRLVVAYRVSGTKVHDARIVAAMIAYGIHHILTFDRSGFGRYTEIMAVHPQNIVQEP